MSKLLEKERVNLVDVGQLRAHNPAPDDIIAQAKTRFDQALMALGIDDTSPEAAVAASAFGGLRRAVAHLATASVAGREAVSGGTDPAALRRDTVGDASAAVRVIRPR